MTVTELMTGKTPSNSYEGFSTADDMVLAVDFGSAANAAVGTYLVAQEGVKSNAGSLSAQTQESQYLRSGKTTVKTGTSRSFKLTGDRYHGDAFQDALLAHAMKYGTGSAVIKPYVYFDALTGKGERGRVSIVIEDDMSGDAGANAGFSATLTSVGTPTEYTYSASN